MKLITLLILVLAFTSFSQEQPKPQVGIYFNTGLRDATFGATMLKKRYGCGLGLNIKHSTRNGILRMVYGLGYSYDYYMAESKSDISTYTIFSKVQGLEIILRPEFRFVNQPKFSMYGGIGPRFCNFYSYKRRTNTLENGVTTLTNWQSVGYNEKSMFGIHANISLDYKVTEHFVLNAGINAFTSFEFEFYDGDIYSGGNLHAGFMYSF